MKRLAILLSVLLVVAACRVDEQAPAPVTHYGTGAGAGSAGAHSVIAGDTIYIISQRYSIPMRDIAAYNNLNPPFFLKPGQRLRLPPPREYVVRRGDSLYTLSRMFGLSTSDMASQNNLGAPYTLSAGQVLKLPAVPAPAEDGYRVASYAPVRAVPTPPHLVRSSPAPAGGPMVKIAPPPVPVTAMVQGGTKVEVYTPPDPVEVAVSLPDEPLQHKPSPRSPVTAKTPKRASNKFLRPVSGKVVSGYGPKANGLHNDGINIRAEEGAPVHAAENGVVVYAGDELKGSGNLILIRHADRWMTAYAHMGNVTVKRGDTVTRGQMIGTVGTSGSVDAPQLHFEVRRGTEALNPQPYMEG